MELPVRAGDARRPHGGAVIRARILRAATALGLIAACACDTRRMSIAEVRSDPGRHLGGEVVLSGRVEGALMLPVLSPSAYWLDDGTGRMLVICRSEPALARTQVVMRGHLRAAAVLGTVVVGLHVEEESRRAVEPP